MAGDGDGAIRPVFFFVTVPRGRLRYRDRMSRFVLLSALLAPLVPVLAGPGHPGGEIPGVLRELSGLAASRRAPELFWAHNDSGDTNRIYAIDRQARLRALVTLQGFAARDWEDIASGVDANGTPWLFVANTGDNLSLHRDKQIAALVEPALPSNGVTEITVTNVEVIRFTLPEGERVDTETLAVDMAAREFLVCTKEKPEGRVYAVAWNASTVQVARLLGRVPVARATAGDLSPDGLRLAIRNLDAISVWTRTPGEPWGDALRRAPTSLPLDKEKQGEAFTWLPGGKGYATASEKPGAMLFLYGE